MVLHGIKPEYLRPTVSVNDRPSRQALRSASTISLVVPPFKLITIGSRAYPVAGPQVWNSLLEDTASAVAVDLTPKIKTYMFGGSFPILSFEFNLFHSL